MNRSCDELTTLYTDDPTDDRARPQPRRTLAIGVAGATVLALVAGLLAITRIDGEDDAPAARRPVSFGEWRPMPEGPIGPRPFAVSVWTGTEALFWAGSSLSRGFAYTDGATFDPERDSWRQASVPVWGHPGLTGAYLDGQVYALAKGGGSRFDLTTREWVSLPLVERAFLAGTVATDEAIWGLGPTAINPAGQPDLAIVRYEPVTDEWTYGTVFEGTAEAAEIVAGLSSLETQVVWTGREILAWNGRHGGLAYDPVGMRWRTVPPPAPASGSLVGGVVAVTDAGIALVAEVDSADGASTWEVARLVGDEWTWRSSQIPVAAPDTLSVAGAGDWVVLFTEGHGPITVHVPTGDWTRHDDGPLAGLTAPNAVWTGEELVVWGGVATPTDDTPNPPDGAVWTSPAG